MFTGICPVFAQQLFITGNIKNIVNNLKSAYFPAKAGQCLQLLGSLPMMAPERTQQVINAAVLWK